MLEQYTQVSNKKIKLKARFKGLFTEFNIISFCGVDIKKRIAY